MKTSILFLSLLLPSWSALFAEAIPPLDLKGARVLVCAGYLDLPNIPAVRRLKAAGAERRQDDPARHLAFGKQMRS